MQHSAFHSCWVLDLTRVHNKNFERLEGHSQDGKNFGASCVKMSLKGIETNHECAWLHRSARGCYSCPIQVVSCGSTSLGLFAMVKLKNAYNFIATLGKHGARHFQWNYTSDFSNKPSFLSSSHLTQSHVRHIPHADVDTCFNCFTHVSSSPQSGTSIHW